MTSETTDEPAPLNRRGLIPVWAPLLVMAAVILTGVVLSGVGTSYVVLFTVAAAVCTALVELRGLFLTVVLLPVYWFFGITGVGLISAGSGTAGSSFKTTLITAAYPAIEKFLWLAVAFVICVVIAVARHRIDAAVLKAQHRRDRSRRRQMTDAEESNQRLNARYRDKDRPSGDRASYRAERPERPERLERSERPERTDRSEPRAASSRRYSERPRGDYPRYPSQRDEASRGTQDSPAPNGQEQPETRTRTAAELREASRRRRSRSQDRPLDME